MAAIAAIFPSHGGSIILGYFVLRTCLGYPHDRLVFGLHRVLQMVVCPSHSFITGLPVLCIVSGSPRRSRLRVEVRRCGRGAHIGRIAMLSLATVLRVRRAIVRGKIVGGLRMP